MSDDSSGSRLPPPAFPPGSRKRLSNNSSAPVESTELDDAFISPDEPMPERDRSVEDAFISPDDPMPERKDPIIEPAIPPHEPSGSLDSPNDPMPTGDNVATHTGELPQFETEGGVVTGIGMDEHLDTEQLTSGGDPYVMDLVQKVGKLAQALRAKGEAGLRSTPEMDQFEATLRGYCVGYLAGRRAEDDPGGDY